MAIPISLAYDCLNCSCDHTNCLIPLDKLPVLHSLDIVTGDSGLKFLARSLHMIPNPTLQTISLNIIHFPCTWSGTVKEDLKRVDKALMEIVDRDAFVQMMVHSQFYPNRQYSRKASVATIEAGFPGMTDLFRKSVLCPS